MNRCHSILGLPSFSNKLAEMRNFTEYSGAEEWLRQTYPHLHAAWLQTFSNLENFNVMNMQLTCMVCQIKPSSGLHYGVKMCEADKQFLKRSFHYQIVYPKCGKEGECPPRPRGWCQICRLGRCLSTPVTISMIRIGNKSQPDKQSKKEAVPLFTIKVELPDQLPQAPLQPSIVPKEETPCQPLDLRIPRKRDEAKWICQQPSELPIQGVRRNFDEPVDLSSPSFNKHQAEDNATSRPSSSYRRTPSPILETVQEELNTPPSFHTDQVEADKILIPSSSYERTSPLLETIQKLNTPPYFNTDQDESRPSSRDSRTPSPIQPLNTPPSFHTDQIEAADILRPSSSDSSYRRTPSPILETIQALNTPPSSLSPILEAIQLLNTPPSVCKDEIEATGIWRPSSGSSSYGRSLSPILETIQALNTPPSFHTDQVEAADYSGPSSSDSSYRRTPSSILDASQALNKLTLNSAVLGEALSRIHGNISMLDSLVELSCVSDILSETSRELSLFNVTINE